MYTLFLKSTIRYLLKNKLYTLINVLGLAIGIASFVLIMLYVNYERSYDTFTGSEDVYRVYMDYREGDYFAPGDAQAYRISGPTLKQEFPEIDEFVRLRQLSDPVLKYKNAILEGHTGSLADPSVFRVLNYTLIRGDKTTALEEPYTVLLTESLARKIFGNEDPLGKTLSLFRGSKISLTVTGIISDPPITSHIKNEFLISFETFYTWDIFRQEKDMTWNQNNFFTYIKVDAHTQPKLLKEKIKNFKPEGLNNERHNIEALEDIHLHSDKPYEAEVNGSATRVRFLSAMAFIVILLSWFNYVNLSTAKSMERVAEIGIRKVMGARRLQLILQILAETLLLNGIAVGIAIAAVVFILPTLNHFLNIHLTFGPKEVVGFLPYLGFMLCGILLSGLYPALVTLKSLSPSTLKGNINSSASGGGIHIRKGLIIGQVLATVVLLTGTIVINRQIKYINEQPIGFDLHQVVALNGKVLNDAPDSVNTHRFKTLESELQKFPFVKGVSAASTYPGDGFYNLFSSIGIIFPDGTEDNQSVWYNYAVEPDYFEVMDMQFIAGTPFPPSANGQSHNVVINEEFARFLGIFPVEEAVNQTIEFWDQDWVVTGVLKNYHHWGLKSKIDPILIRQGYNPGNLLVKLDGASLSSSSPNEALSRIESTWKEIFSESTFDFTFVDQKFQAQYEEDRKFGQAFGIFTFLAILIAMMGLFGLTAYTLVQRRKEIGIRKVLGASVSSVVALLSKDFIRLVLIAIVIATPIAWFVMNRWLQGFAYRIELQWWMFAGAGLVAVVIAMVTVSGQSVKAAMADPIDSVKSE